jgi:hypothetical protein
MPRIEFHTLAEAIDLVPHPYPAARHTPEWFKSMAADLGDAASVTGGTIKRCPPFLAAMTAGYIIPAPADARITMTPAGAIEARGTLNFLSTHFPGQVAGAPFGNRRIVKFENPWIIVTPPEFVSLITAPVNRFELPFTPLTGIVETGTYYREVHLPMACQMRPGEEFFLRRGEPMIHVIPIRRDEWESGVGPIDPALRADQQAMLDASPHFYKDKFWRKLTYG